MTIVIRPETAQDIASIRRVNELAFGGAGEAELVDALRDSEAWLPELSLVAEVDREIVGHVLFSLVKLDSDRELLSLGPMAVLPGRQRAGIGSKLVRRGLELAEQTDYPLVVVLGHPEYYPRFGFEPARPLGIETRYEVPGDAWMALPLPAFDPRARGTVQYPPAWSAV